jgi:hypothetical protein
VSWQQSPHTSESLVWDGCQFVLAHTNGINPSSIQLVMFP